MELTELEEELLFRIGFLGQLENEIFDIYKDHKVGLRTLATNTRTIPELKKIYFKDRSSRRGSKNQDLPKEIIYYK